jgi:Flp pilus assembly protein TadG
MIRRLSHWLRDDGAVVAPIFALALVPMIGMLALGGEVTSWYMKQRQLQNVADSAALAAAANASTGYATEAKGMTTQYGFLDDAAHDLDITTVNNATCPGTASATCYQVTVVQKVPLYLTQVVGYTGAGTTMADGRRATLIRATSIALGKFAVNYCMTGLGTADGPVNGQHGNIDLRGNGNGFENCGAQTKGTVSCTSVTFGYIQAPNNHGGQCEPEYTTMPASSVIDPYASRNFSTLIATAIAGAPCAAAGTLTGTITTTVTKVCASTGPMTGNITLSGNGTDPPILVIYDTTLNKNGFNLTTTTGLNAKGGTIIVTGAGATGSTNSNTWFSGSGDLTIQGANGGSFDDMTIIVDPKYASAAPYMPGGGSHVDLHALGTIYAPATDIAIQGSMDAQIGSYACVSIVAKSIYVNGGSMDNDPLDCKALGFNLAEAVITRQALVQ